MENIQLKDQSEMSNITAQLDVMMKLIQDFSQKQTQQEANISAINNYLTNLNNEAPEPQPATVPIANFGELCKIPDPIKMLPTFDGNRRQLNAWLETAEETLENFKQFVTEQQFKIYVTAVNNKIQGKAKDILCLAGNPSNFGDIKKILVAALGDRQELSTYKSKLWGLSMVNDGLTVFKYYEKTKEMVQNIKILAKQNEIFLRSWEAINLFIEQDALAAFIAGLEEPLFGYVQAARPKDLEDAYAFLCTFKSKETTVHNISKSKNTAAQYNTSSGTKKFQDRTNAPVNQGKPQFNPKPFSNNSQSPPGPSHSKFGQPMDTESTRSKLTLNRKSINNHETILEKDDEPTGSSESESENEELTVNFWQTIKKNNDT